LSEKVKGREDVGDLGIDRRIILKRIFKKYSGRMRTGESGAGF
jgi:hypothetical protein